MYEFFNLGDYRTIIVRIREIKDKGKGKHKAREGGGYNKSFAPGRNTELPLIHFQRSLATFFPDSCPLSNSIWKFLNKHRLLAS